MTPELHFSPQDESFDQATQEYAIIWVTEGAKIIAALERVTGLPFLEQNITAIVYEGMSSSGKGDEPMHIRASYTREQKLATLIHELGHRHISGVKMSPRELTSHQRLDLFLYDVWVDLYGQEFADRNVAIERTRTASDYDVSWTWALSMTREERRGYLKKAVRD